MGQMYAPQTKTFGCLNGAAIGPVLTGLDGPCYTPSVRTQQHSFRPGSQWATGEPGEIFVWGAQNEPVEPHGTTPESMRVAALIHLTPGIEQRALVRYASKFAHCADTLTSLDSAELEPEHRRALCESTSRDCVAA